MWISQSKSISIIRLKDNKKKVFQGYWVVNENMPNETIAPIGLEFESKSGRIFGLVEDSQKKYYFITMNFKEKKKMVYPTSAINPNGKLILLQPQTSLLFVYLHQETIS